jgi:actin-related protein
VCGEIVLAGGNTLLTGLAERLQGELSNMQIHSTVPSVYKVVAAPDRKFGAWIGCSILASLPTFQEGHWITKDEYQQIGARVVRRKCLQ